MKIQKLKINKEFSITKNPFKTEQWGYYETLTISASDYFYFLARGKTLPNVCRIIINSLE